MSKRQALEGLGDAVELEEEIACQAQAPQVFEFGKRVYERGVEHRAQQGEIMMPIMWSGFCNHLERQELRSQKSIKETLFSKGFFKHILILLTRKPVFAMSKPGF